MANPLDKVLREFARPALSGAGYEWKNRRYWKIADSGDVVGMDFQASEPFWGEAAFFINLGYVTAARRDELIEAGKHDGTPTYGSLILRRFHVPPSMVSEMLSGERWEILGEDRRLFGAPLERALREHAIPMLDQLLDRRAAIDCFLHPSDTVMSAWSNWASLFWVLIDEGPSSALSHTWTRLEGRALFEHHLAWGRRRLSSRFGAAAVEDGRPVSATPMRAAVERLAWGPIAAALSDAGFVLDGEVFRLFNDLGDQLVVQIREAFTSTDGSPKFSIDYAVVPRLLWDWLRAHPRRMNEDVAYVADGWFQRRIAPPSADAERNTIDGAFDLELWPINGDAAAIEDSLTNTLRGELATAEALLDRRHIWATRFGADVPFGQPTEPHEGRERFILTMDLEPDRIRRELDDADASGVRIAIDEDAAWARTWLDKQARR